MRVAEKKAGSSVFDANHFSGQICSKHVTLSDAPPQVGGYCTRGDNIYNNAG